MKKKFKDTKVGKLLKSKTMKSIGDFAKGALLDPVKIGGAPIVGAVVGAIEGVKEIKKSNIESEGGGYGKINIPRLVGLLIFIALSVLLITGVIDQDTFEILFNRLNELNQ